MLGTGFFPAGHKDVALKPKREGSKLSGLRSSVSEGFVKEVTVSVCSL